jgi:hypothetical protein
MQVVERVGSEFLVNTVTDTNQNYPSITALANGGFVVTWESRINLFGSGMQNIKAQIFGPDGVPVGVEFLVNSETAGEQLFPIIGNLSNGGFVISWYDYDSGTLGDASTGSVKAQVFNSYGVKIGSEFLVNTETASQQVPDAITGLANGKFVISWRDHSGTLGDTSGSSIKAQIFSADGSKFGSEFLVNTETGVNQDSASIAGLTDGGFVITWTDDGGTPNDPTSNGIKAQTFSADGAKVGGEFLVNTETTGWQNGPTIAGLANGQFVILWTDSSGTLGDKSSYGIKAQLFSANGVKVGNEFLVNTQTDGFQGGSEVTVLASGDFVVTWTDFNEPMGDSSQRSIKAQAFSADGSKIGTEFLVNTQAEGSQQYPTITGLTGGQFAISWDDVSGTLGDASGSSIKAQIFSAYGTFTGTAGLDTLAGNAGRDVINGLGGIDIMNGAGGSDIYIIASSTHHKAAEIADTGASGTDEVRFSAAKSDTLKIFAGDTGIERVVIGTGTGATADSSGTLSLHIDASKAVNALTLIGNAGVNRLTGTVFNDTIDGCIGADRMTGGAGDDTYIVDNVKDAISEKAIGGGTDTAMASTGYTLAMNVENLTLTGSANISGTGNMLNNAIIGNSGNNTLFGGLGNDTLTGGAGADTFIFNTKPNAATNVDTITDFSSSDGDHLQFSLKLFKTLGAVGDLTADQFWAGAGITTAHDATDRLIYNTTSGDLYYDSDGSGVRYAAVLVANLSGSPTLS